MRYKSGTYLSPLHYIEATSTKVSFVVFWVFDEITQKSDMTACSSIHRVSISVRTALLQLVIFNTKLRAGRFSQFINERKVLSKEMTYLNQHSFPDTTIRFNTAAKNPCSTFLLALVSTAITIFTSYYCNHDVNVAERAIPTQSIGENS